MVPAAHFTALSEEIDQLLAHYLELLDQYTALRSQLSVLQSSVHQHISRANFSAERGVRYGSDFYDARMQATRVCCITVPSSAAATAEEVRQDHYAVDGQSLGNVEQSAAAVSANIGGEDLRGRTTATASFTISTVSNNGQRKKKAEDISTADEKSETTKNASKDPLRMFGLLTPSSLRQAQAESIKTMENVIPRLVSLDMEMKEVEIQVRRARKWKAKAEAKEDKETATEKVRETEVERREVMV